VDTRAAGEASHEFISRLREASIRPIPFDPRPTSFPAIPSR
jgi:hypothetical protein